MLDYVNDDLMVAEDEESSLLEPTRRKSQLQEEFRNRKYGLKVYRDKRLVAIATCFVSLLAIVSLIAVIVNIDSFHGITDVTSLLETQDTTDRIHNHTVIINGTQYEICDMEGHGVCLERNFLGFCTEHGPCVPAPAGIPTMVPTYSPGDESWDWDDDWGWTDDGWNWNWDWDWGEWPNGTDPHGGHPHGGQGDDDWNMNDVNWDWNWDWGSDGDDRNHSHGNSTDDGWDWGNWDWHYHGDPWELPKPGDPATLAPASAPAPLPGWDIGWGWGDGDSVPTAVPTPRPSTTTDCNPWDPPCRYDSKDLQGIWFCVEYWPCDNNTHYGLETPEVEPLPGWDLDWFDSSPTSTPTAMGECQQCSCWEDDCVERFLGWCTKYAGNTCPFEVGEYDGNEYNSEKDEDLQERTVKELEKEEDVQHISEEEEARDKSFNVSFPHEIRKQAAQLMEQKNN